jgi:hypothetical protein
MSVVDIEDGASVRRNAKVKVNLMTYLCESLLVLLILNIIYVTTQ